MENKFKEHCEPLTSKNFNRHLFLERRQREHETVDEFCGALKTLAKKSRGIMVTSKLDLGLRDLKLKERLMEKERTLEETLQAETSKQHMQNIGADGGKIESVDAVSTQSSHGAKSSSGKGRKSGRFDSGKEDKNIEARA